MPSFIFNDLPRYVRVTADTAIWAHCVPSRSDGAISKRSEFRTILVVAFPCPRYEPASRD